MNSPPFDASLFEVILNQRAYRELKSDPVPDELIEQILKAGTHAPSAVNKQPWHFVVVQDANVRQKISQGTSEAWQAYAKMQTQDPNDPLYKAAERWATEGLQRAPVIIVVCGDTRVMPVEEMGSSIFPAAQNILLAASALGLGSLMASLPIFAPDGAFAHALNLPDYIVPLATLPVGYPKKALGKPRRKPVESVTSRDRYGELW
jgi:nitroreductase